jgi:hypothetical protein
MLKLSVITLSISVIVKVFSISSFVDFNIIAELLQFCYSGHTDDTHTCINVFQTKKNSFSSAVNIPLYCLLSSLKVYTITRSLKG